MDSWHDVVCMYMCLYVFVRDCVCILLNATNMRTHLACGAGFKSPKGFRVACIEVGVPFFISFGDSIDRKEGMQNKSIITDAGWYDE